MASPTNQSAVLRVAQFLRRTDITSPIPESIWDSFRNVSPTDIPSIISQAQTMVEASRKVERAANIGSVSESITLYPDSDTVEYRVKVKFTRQDGTATYRTYRNRADSSGGISGILQDIDDFISNLFNRYGYESYTILYDSLIVWGN